MSLDGLLRVQELDTTIDQLRHRRESLPERDERQEVADQRTALDARLATVDEERDGLIREQRRLEDEVAMLEDKTASEQAKLYEGGVTSPKEAQALQDEIDSLKRHQDSLEDRIIGFMEQIEPLTENRTGIEAEITAGETRSEELSLTITGQEAEIDAELDAMVAERAETADGLEGDALDRYDTARPGFGGSTVVGFDGKNCSGCPLSMPAVEADRVKKTDPGTLVDCLECGRLVAR